MRTGRWLALLLVLAGAPGAPRAESPSEAERLEARHADLERRREQRPREVDLRIELGTLSYQIARDALDRSGDEERYLTYLEKSVEEFVVAAELEPRDPRPHFYLAVMDTYRGDLRRALRGFLNAKRLGPNGVAYTNIAEILVYMGQVEKAQAWNDLGMRRGAPYGAALFNDMLIAWRRGNLSSARGHFQSLSRQAPEMLRTINMARLPEAPRSFDDFAGYCCGSPACGPYMVEACRALTLDVAERSVSEETVLRELRIEMERERRLREVYRQRKELEIEVEDDPADP